MRFSRRMLGFALVGVAVLGTFLVYSVVEGYHPNGDLAYNLANAEYRFYEVHEERRECPRPGDPFTTSIPDDCPTSDALWRLAMAPGGRGAYHTVEVRRRTGGIPLGQLLLGPLASGIVGIGMIATGRQD